MDKSEEIFLQDKHQCPVAAGNDARMANTSRAANARPLVIKGVMPQTSYHSSLIQHGSFFCKKVFFKTWQFKLFLRRMGNVA